MKVSEAPRDKALPEPGHSPTVDGRVAQFVRRVTTRLGAVTWTQRAALAIVLLGGALRLYHFDSLSLWVDEGLTVAYARYPWPTVLGFHGAYDVHPPLYYAVVKLMTVLAPEVVAGRLVSVIAGTLTIGVLYALVSRLAGPRVALGAALVLAVSPFHIWYSQEARQYALTALLVSVSYLALMAYYQRGRSRWAVAYALSLALALYVEISALFALVPQVLVLAWFARTRARRTLVLAGAGMVGALAFVPWLPRLVQVAAPESTHAQFALTPHKVWSSLLAVTGLGGNADYFWSAQPAAWDRWSQWGWLLVGGMLAVAALGVIALAPRSVAALLTALGLLLGTIAVAVIVSLRYPSYTDRTVLYAVLGWSIVAGAAPAVAGLRSWMTTVGTAGVCLVLAVSVVTLGSMYTGASKQPFHQLADDTDRAAAFGWSVMTYPVLTGIIIDAYHPHLLDGRHYSMSDNGLLPPLTSPGRHLPPAFWFARVGGPNDVPAPAQQKLSALGYLRLLHQDYPAPLSLDLYVRSGVNLGRQLGVNGGFAGSGPTAAGWVFPAGGFSFSPGQGSSRQLVLGNATSGGQSAPTRFALAIVPAVPAALYSLRLRERMGLGGGIFQSFLICQSSAGAFLSVAPGAAGPQVGKAPGWNDFRAAILCPAGTTSLRIDLRVTGAGQDAIRAVQVQEVRSHGPTP